MHTTFVLALLAAVQAGFAAPDDGHPPPPGPPSPSCSEGGSSGPADGYGPSPVSDCPPSPSPPNAPYMPGTPASPYGYGSSSITGTSEPTASSSTSSPSSSSTAGATCSDPATSFHLSDPPYENYFYSDCHTAAQVVVTSPRPGDNLTIIGPRLLVAWPAGNSGVVAFFAPQNGVNGTLGIEIENGTSGNALEPVYLPPPSGSNFPSVGVSGIFKLNDSAVLTLSILGSEPYLDTFGYARADSMTGVRTLRDFIEGPSILVPEIQNAIKFQEDSNGGVTLSRVWLDNVTITDFSFTPQGTSNSSENPVRVDNRTVKFEAGSYNFSAHFNYPQLEQLSPKQVSEQSCAKDCVGL